MMTTYTIDPWKFAQDWQDGWNSHDLDRIMAHYHKDGVFRSVKAQALVGRGKLIGRHELCRYWAKALERQPDLKFQVHEVFQGYQMMTLSYRNQTISSQQKQCISTQRAWSFAPPPVTKPHSARPTTAAHPSNNSDVVFTK
jgi:nuclear transport factor 2 (NTF2) superfamily protein